MSILSSNTTATMASTSTGDVEKSNDNMMDVKHQQSVPRKLQSTADVVTKLMWDEWLSYSYANRIYVPFATESLGRKLNDMKYNIGDYVYVHFGNIPYDVIKSGKVQLGTHVFAACVKSQAVPHMGTCVNSMLVELMEPMHSEWSKYNTQNVDLFCAFPDSLVQDAPSILNTIDVSNIKLSRNKA